MVEVQDSQDSRLDAVFHALGDPTRRRMLGRLAQGQQSVGQLAEPFRMSLAAASKHIKALESAGLIAREVQGRTHICRLNADPLSEASAWLRHYEQFWTARLDRLEALLRADAAHATVDTPALQDDAAARRTPATKSAPTPTKRPRSPR